MNIAQLREFTNNIPEGMSKEEFDALEVQVPYETGFFPVCMEESGVIEFGPPCDAEGNEIDPLEGWEDVNKMIVLFSMGFTDNEVAKGNITVKKLDEE